MNSPTTKGPGGTEGGQWLFIFGALLAIAGAYLFFDSVRITTGHGALSGMMGARGGGGMWDTASKGILFLPFLIGVVALFFDVRMKWAWVVLGLGILLLGVEIISQIRFVMNMKLTYLLGMLLLFGAGLGLMLRSYVAATAGAGEKPNPPDESDSKPEQP